MRVSEEHIERLRFIAQYFITIEEGARFQADQLFTREVARLDQQGIPRGDPEGDQRAADVQQFAMEVASTMRAQMVIVLFSFFENLFRSAMLSIKQYKGISADFPERRRGGIVKRWEEYLVNDLEVKTISKMDWRRLSDIAHVRNFIAHGTHRPGHQPRGAQLAASERLEGIRLEHDGISVLTSFVDESVVFAHDILKKLGGDHWEQSERIDWSFLRE